jgi:hypothetical protein
MPRRSFDLILTAIGGVLAVGLLIAGGLLTWGYHFANSTVHDQLAAEQIFFPAKGSDALASPEVGPYLNQYAGQQLTTGAQAEAYADHFIKVHLKEVAGGKTYAQVSTEAQQNPTDQKLQGQVQTLFRGETLRGMLLNAYAFWKFGQIALYSAIASLAGAVILFALTLLGLRHARRVDTTAQLFDKKTATAAA